MQGDISSSKCPRRKWTSTNRRFAMHHRPYGMFLWLTCWVWYVAFSFHLETGVGCLSLLLLIPLRFMVTACRTACCGVGDRPLFLSAGDSWLCCELNVTLTAELFGLLQPAQLPSVLKVTNWYLWFSPVRFRTIVSNLTVWFSVRIWYFLNVLVLIYNMKELIFQATNGFDCLKKTVRSSNLLGCLAVEKVILTKCDSLY